MRAERWRALVACGCGLATVLAAGCAPGTATVSGKVAFRRPPATPEPVAVSLVGPSGLPVTAEVGPDGTYVAEGVGVGKVKVALTCLPTAYSEAYAAYVGAQEEKETEKDQLKPAARKPKGKRPRPAGPPDLSKYPNPVPRLYWNPDQSPLSLTTKPGANVFDIEVAN